METRKIQLIGGSTYTVSLPKPWIRLNNLSEQDKLSIIENGDKTLTISPIHKEIIQKEEILIPLEEHQEGIVQAIFSSYYQGFSTISITSRKEISKRIKAQIRVAINNLSGTEISYEDSQSVKISVLIDKTRIDILQIFYRMSLLVEASIETIIEKINLKEIKTNEDEIDRLYHLTTKVLSLSMHDIKVLKTSKVEHTILIPPYLLFVKRLENIGDSCNRLAKYLYRTKQKSIQLHKLLSFAQEEMTRTVKYIVSQKKETFDPFSADIYKQIKEDCKKNISDETVRYRMLELWRVIKDLEDQAATLSFYKSLIRNQKV